MFGGYCVPSTRQRAKPFEPIEVFRQTKFPSANGGESCYLSATAHTSHSFRRETG